MKRDACPMGLPAREHVARRRPEIPRGKPEVTEMIEDVSAWPPMASAWREATVDSPSLAAYTLAASPRPAPTMQTSTRCSTSTSSGQPVRRATELLGRARGEDEVDGGHPHEG